MKTLSNASGFSLVEVVVSVLVLAVGLLGLAAGTGWVLRSTDGARVDTARTTAIQSSIERVRATPFDNLADGGSFELPGSYSVEWVQVGTTPQSSQLQIVLTGPGRVPSEGGYPQFNAEVVDTITYRVLR